MLTNAVSTIGINTASVTNRGKLASFCEPIGDTGSEDGDTAECMLSELTLLQKLPLRPLQIRGRVFELTGVLAHALRNKGCCSWISSRRKRASQGDSELACSFPLD